MSVSYDDVVIPIQTIGFYNMVLRAMATKFLVVIPIQTIGFYNASSLPASLVLLKLSYLSKR